MVISLSYEEHFSKSVFFRIREIKFKETFPKNEDLYPGEYLKDLQPTLKFKGQKKPKRKFIYSYNGYNIIDNELPFKFNSLVSMSNNNIEFKIPKHKIISNVTADSITDPEIIKKLLIKQIYSSVKWRESILRMSKEKVRNFIEIGPGKVLTGMVKRTIKGANCFSINSIADIKNLQNEFKK